MALPGASHCEIHRAKARSLYLKYNDLSDRVDQMDFDDICQKISSKGSIKDQIKYLMNYYILLDKTYKARMKHRQYAIVPEFYDKGHDFQFTRLNELMACCEDKLSELYKLEESESNIKISTETSTKTNVKANAKANTKTNAKTDAKTDTKMSTNMSLVKYTDKAKYNQSSMSLARSKRDEEINQWIEHYIADNQRLLQDKQKLMDFLLKNVIGLFDAYQGHDIELFWQCVIISSLTNQLCKIGYFDPDFEPMVCPECNCGEYIPYDFRIGCNCMKSCESVYEFLNRSPKEILEKFFRILLLNKNKILAIIPDLIYLYKIYGTNIFFMNLLLTWDPARKRLRPEPDDSPPEVKNSQLYALHRLKKKFYDREVSKINERYENS
jgi:hypothetical protein